MNNEFNMFRRFKNRSTGKISNQFMDVCLDSKELTLDTDFLSQHSNDFKTPFFEIENVPYEKCFSQAYKDLLTLPNENKAEVALKHSIDVQYTLLKDYIYSKWDNSKFNIIFHSSGYDSRILSLIIRELYEEHGKEWLGKMVFLCHDPEGGIFNHIMVNEGWGYSNSIVNYDHECLGWRNREVFDFNKMWKFLNGPSDFPASPDAVFFDRLYKGNWFNTDKKDCRFWFGSFGNEVFNFFVLQNKVFKDFCDTFYYSRYARFVSYFDVKNIINPFLDPKRVEYLLSIKLLNAPTDQNIFKQLIIDKSRLGSVLDSVPVFPPEKLKDSWCCPEMLFNKLVKDYEKSFFYKKVGDSGYRDRFFGLSKEQNEWWSDCTLASLCDELIRRGVKIKLKNKKKKENKEIVKKEENKEIVKKEENKEIVKKEENKEIVKKEENKEDDFSSVEDFTLFFNKLIKKKGKKWVEENKKVLTIIGIAFEELSSITKKNNYKYLIKDNATKNKTDADLFWNKRTVLSKKKNLNSKDELLEYMEWRLNYYPCCREFLDLYGSHNRDIILDYGCGPGFDTIGFILEGKAKKVIAMDVSEKALKQTQKHLNLCNINPNRVELIKIGNKIDRLPLEDNSIDRIHCGGVIHHVDDPAFVLKEFNRILKKNKFATIMVYNKNSLFYHLYVAYVVRIKNKADYAKLEFIHNDSTVDYIFSKLTDGHFCPISRCYYPAEFALLCKDNGFSTIEFKGGHLSSIDNKKYYQKYFMDALSSSELEEMHKEFLRGVSFDENDSPVYRGKACGIGGSYKLWKV